MRMLRAIDVKPIFKIIDGDYLINELRKIYIVLVICVKRGSFHRVYLFLFTFKSFPASHHICLIHVQEEDNEVYN